MKDYFFTESVLLPEEEAIKAIQKLGFKLSTFEQWDNDSCEFDFAEQWQFATYDTNIEQLKRYNCYKNKKFYIVPASDNTCTVRIWMMRK